MILRDILSIIEPEYKVQIQKWDEATKCTLSYTQEECPEEWLDDKVMNAKWIDTTNWQYYLIVVE